MTDTSSGSRWRRVDSGAVEGIPLAPFQHQKLARGGLYVDRGRSSSCPAAGTGQPAPLRISLSIILFSSLTSN